MTFIFDPIEESSSHVLIVSASEMEGWVFKYQWGHT